MKYILASGSPRRRELLTLAGLEFRVVIPEIEEQILPGLSPEEVVVSLAQQKAAAVAAQHPRDCVISADTIVYLDGVFFGKPQSPAAAAESLRCLSGREHVVTTGVFIHAPQRNISFFEETKVTFFPLTETEIQSYIATGEPMDKAGAYAIQGRGALFVRRIEGDFYTVVGFPIARFMRELPSFSTRV